MTLSLLLNNGQLTLPKGGKLPQSTSCCCDLSPPPCDNCIDSCFYFVEVTSPKEVSLKTPAVTCQNGARNLVRIVSDREDAVPTWIDAAPESLDPTFGHQNIDLVNFPTIVEGVGNINLGGYILEAWEGNVDVDFLQGGMGLGVGTRIGCSLYCDYNQAPPSMYLDFGGWVLATTFGGSRYSKPGQPVSDWRWEFNGTIPVTLTQCRDVAQQLCYANATSGDKWLGRLIATPLTFTIDKNGCSLGGSMISRVLTWNTASAAYEHVLAAGEAVRDAFSYTFKITSRPSCHVVSADCDVPIGNGDMTVVIATDPSQPAGTYGNDSFILGTAGNHVYSGPDDTTVRIEHFGAAAGDSGCPQQADH